MAGRWWPTYSGISILSPSHQLKNLKNVVSVGPPPPGKLSGSVHGDTYFFYSVGSRERSGSMVECLTRDRGAAGSTSPASLRCGPWARHIYPSLVLVQPRKTRPCLTERLLMGRKESNKHSVGSWKACCSKCSYKQCRHWINDAKETAWIHSLIFKKSFCLHNAFCHDTALVLWNDNV